MAESSPSAMSSSNSSSSDTSYDDDVLAAVKCDYNDNSPPFGSFDKLVQVCAGHGDLKKEFPVHHGVLRHQSLAFNYTLKIDGSYELSLPSVDPVIFETTQYWMYRGKFWDPRSCEDGEIPLSFQDALDIYFFAANNSMHDLQNHALSLVYCMTAQDDWSVSASQIDTIYENTTTDSPLRRFLITVFADRWAFSAEEDWLPHELLLDVVLRQQDLQMAPNAWKVPDWIREMNKTFCERFHSHDTKNDDDENAVDADGAENSSETVGEDDDMEIKLEPV